MTPYLCKTASEKRYSLHNHSGWFDFEGDTIRSLTNVNIDVVEPEKAQIIEQPTRISLFTMRRIEALIGVIDRPRERIGSLHIYLKEVFRCIITDEAAVRVALAD